jgi:hypothetical protein
LLEDAEDVAGFLLATNRTVSPWTWAEEAIAAVQRDQLEGLF